jgi:hypothetical protein
MLTWETEELGEKSCLDATLSSTHSVWSALAANPYLCSENTTTNRLSYGTTAQPSDDVY